MNDDNTVCWRVFYINNYGYQSHMDFDTYQDACGFYGKLCCSMPYAAPPKPISVFDLIKEHNQ